MPAVGSSRMISVGLVDEGAGELETALHPAGQLARPAAAGVPQVDELEHLADPAPAAPQQHPEQARDEVDVLAGGEVRVQREQLGHVADPLAGPAAEAARVLAEDPDLARRRGRARRSASGSSSSCRRPTGR